VSKKGGATVRKNLDVRGCKKWAFFLDTKLGGGKVVRTVERRGYHHVLVETFCVVEVSAFNPKGVTPIGEIFPGQGKRRHQVTL